MSRDAGLRTVPHLSIQSDRRTILDEVDALLLRRISETSSLTEAARLLGISYRNAWDRIKKIQSSYGKQILETRSGGAAGGSSRLTPEGSTLLKEFRAARKYLFNAMDDRESAGNVGYKLSARNRFRADVKRVERDGITSLIKMTTRAPVSFTSIISEEAVEDLDLHEGDEVVAIIKATEVMVAKPPSSSNEQRPRKRARA
jgi:molybdate transport system regulatory protein